MYFTILKQYLISFTYITNKEVALVPPKNRYLSMNFTQQPYRTLPHWVSIHALQLFLHQHPTKNEPNKKDST